MKKILFLLLTICLLFTFSCKEKDIKTNNEIGETNEIVENDTEVKKYTKVHIFNLKTCYEIVDYELDNNFLHVTIIIPPHYGTTSTTITRLCLPMDSFWLVDSYCPHCR